MSIRELTAEEESQLLTQEEVDSLPEGTRVWVKWSGGNGPHEYTICHTKHGTMAFIPGKEEWMNRFDSLLSPVGKERCHNRVFLSKNNVVMSCICVVPAWKDGVCWNCGARESDKYLIDHFDIYLNKRSNEQFKCPVCGDPDFNCHHDEDL